MYLGLNFKKNSPNNNVSINYLLFGISVFAIVTSFVAFTNGFFELLSIDVNGALIPLFGSVATLYV